MSDNAAPVTNGYKEKFDQLLLNHTTKFKTEEDRDFLMKIYEFAATAHKNMMRYSGKPYISHPLEVARIVTENIGLGKSSVAAALLHDVPNKTEYTTDDIERYFGKKIAGIVRGLKKIKNTEYFSDNYQATIFREILLSISEDIRVIFIKIADKLHGIRTVKYLSVRKQERIVNEVLNIYAPLAHRLGLYEIKNEMEDLCLKQNNPGIYKSIKKKLKSNERERLQFINHFLKPIKKEIEDLGLEFSVQSRAKSIYSIWKKIQQKRVPFKEIYDLFAVRIIYKSDTKNEKTQALKIASAIRKLYTEKTDRNRNWIDTPKETGYQAYHITVQSDEGIWVEVQIRSEQMHYAAEYGFAAHWKYKGIKDRKNKLDEKITDILKNLSKDDMSAENFMDELKLNLFTSEIYVFTPKGQVINLPKHASVLDFAFKIHTTLAYSAISAKINGKVKPLSTKLKNGDKVEIISSNSGEPKKEWFKYVITHRALSGLKTAFREERKIAEDRGKEILHSVLEYAEIANYETATEKLRKEFGIKSNKDFLIDIGDGKIQNDDLENSIQYCCTSRKSKFWTIKITDDKLHDTNYEKNTHKASCCNPLPGDEIVGFIQNETDLYVHKKQCPVLITEISNDNKIINLQWAKYSSISRRREFTLYGNNTKGIMFKLSSVLSSISSINIIKFEFDTEKQRFEAYLMLVMQNEEKVQNIIDKFMNVKEVDQIHLGSKTISAW